MRAKALVFVEGPSDRAGLEILLRPVIAEANERGRSIRFLPKGGKSRLLSEVPGLAVDHLADNPADLVVALPDLYPTRGYENELAHQDYQGLRTVLNRRFHERADRRRISERARARFRVHCLQHDLEALLLASVDQLRARLKTKVRLEEGWALPVELQDGERPPKRIVEHLFLKYRRTRYRDNVDVPTILAEASLEVVVDRCKLRFHPFVTDLRAFARGD